MGLWTLGTGWSQREKRNDQQQWGAMMHVFHYTRTLGQGQEYEYAGQYTLLVRRFEA